MAKRQARSRTSKATEASSVSSVKDAPIAEANDMAHPVANGGTLSASPTEDDIRVRAYERFLERGGGPDGAVDDWVEAEKELRQRR